MTEWDAIRSEIYKIFWFKKLSVIKVSNETCRFRNLSLIEMACQNLSDHLVRKLKDNQ